MYKVKLIIFGLLFFVFFNEIEAQKRISYYDVYEIVKSGDADKAYTLLVAVQKQDPDFANTYFQLGLVAKEWAMEFNPFTEFEYATLFIYNTKLYFNLAKHKIENDKKKNIEYYTNADVKFEGKKLTFEDIIAFINKQVQEIEEYESNITQIIRFFNKSTDHYNKCVNVYREINTEYNTIKNIYLSENDEILSKLKQLEQSFDSTIFYFNNYKEALKRYPLEGYNQNYELKEIITFRLDGLTNSNFLNNNIILWDYKKWVSNVYKTMNEIVTENRKMIFEQDSRIKNQINQLTAENYSDIYKPFKLEDKFIYRIEKYDNNSLLIKLFKLNEAKINYLTLFRKNINNPQKIASYSLFNKSKHCMELIEIKKYADSLNNDFVSGIDSEQVRKYQKFYESMYNGTNGLRQYSLNQSTFFKSKQEEAYKNLKNKLYITKYISPEDSLSYLGKPLEIKKHFPDINTDLKDNYFVTDFIHSKNKKIYFSGYYINKKGKSAGFSGVSKNNSEIGFLKKASKDTSHILHLLTEPFQGGSFVIETSMSNNIYNSLIKYNEKGQILFKKNIPYNKIPGYMTYDDINNSIMIVLSGENLDETVIKDTEQIIYHFNLDDDSKTHTISLPSKSYVFDIIKMDKRIFIFSNFINYLKNDGTKLWSSAGNTNFDTNILLTITSSEGIIEKQVSFNNEKPFFGVEAIKLNSNTINVLGFKSKYINKDYNKLKDKELYYLIIDSEAKEINSYWHD